MYSLMDLLCAGYGLKIFFRGNGICGGLAVRWVMTAAIIPFLRWIIISGICDNSSLAFDYS